MPASSVTLWSWLLPFFATLGLLGFSIASYCLTKHAQRFRTFLSFLNEYRSPEMLAAVRDLHDFKRCCDKKGICLKKEYGQRKDDGERKERDEKDPLKKFQLLETTLHNRRRYVSHFYYALLSAIKSGFVSASDVFNYWGEETFKGMIIDIINPIGQEADKHLEGLYGGARKYNSIRFRKKWYLTKTILKGVEMATVWYALKQAVHALAIGDGILKDRLGEAYKCVIDASIENLLQKNKKNKCFREKVLSIIEDVKNQMKPGIDGMSDEQVRQCAEKILESYDKIKKLW